MPIARVDSAARVPIKIWTDDVEDVAGDQLRNVANLPFIFKHVAVMPDCHWGMGATVGSVIATQGAIVPAAVGVDIGCGMMAVKTTLDAGRTQDSIKKIREGIEGLVPVGFSQHTEPLEVSTKWSGWGRNIDLADTDLYHKAMRQMGTLGGGNHFIEVCLDTGNSVWVMLHSGSRNIGKVLAERHINEAKGLMKKWFVDLPDPDLAYLAEGTREFENYWSDLQWCQSFAMQNRITMMDGIMAILSGLLNSGEPVTRLMEANCHHNYASREHHYGQNVIVTRKGAVRAREDDFGIIPGSMGTRSYIVRGKGVAESFHSCSHGAGRRMSRKKAKQSFQVADLEAQTAGVECRKDKGVIDEIPGAYKDIDVVMANQSDLVEVIAELKQIMCVKG